MTKEKNIVAQLRQDRKVLWIAILTGLAATMLLWFGTKEEKLETVDILVVKEPVSTGERITFSTVELESRPVKYVSPKFIPPKIMQQFGEFISIAPMEPGEVLLWSYVDTGDEEGSFSEAP